MNVGERIKARRKELELSVDDIALALAKDRSTIYRYESSDIEKLPTTILEPLAKILQTTPAHLMGWDEEVNSQQTTNILTPDEINLIINYRILDDIDQAEIRGEIKHMLKADKYTNNLHKEKISSHPTKSYEIAAWGADGTKGTYKSPKREIT